MSACRRQPARPPLRQPRPRRQQQQRAGPQPFSGWGPFSTASKPGRGYAAEQPGPVIDAEWETIDEGDQ